MKMLSKTVCKYKGEKTEAYRLNDDWYLLRCKDGIERVHRSHGQLFLCGPLLEGAPLSEQEKLALDMIYLEAGGWLDADDREYYDYLLNRLHPDTICLRGHKYHVDGQCLTPEQEEVLWQQEMDECQRYHDQNGLDADREHLRRGIESLHN